MNGVAALELVVWEFLIDYFPASKCNSCHYIKTCSINEYSAIVSIYYNV